MPTSSPARDPRPRPDVTEEPDLGLLDARDLAVTLLTSRGPLSRRGDELFLGEQSLTGDTGIVDHVKETTGYGCTLFAGNLRVATTATAAGQDGRAYGTRANDDITRQVLRLGQPFRGITRTIGKDWVIAYDPLRVDDHIIGMVAVYRELLDYADDLSRLDTPESVLLLAPDGTVVDLNQTAIDHAGRPREELVGHSAGALLATTWSEQPCRDVELELLWSQPDGFQFPVHAQATWIDGLGHLVVCRDYSSEVRARQSMAQANAQLQEAKRAAERANEAKSMFLANVSHELRTPLTAVIGYTELLREEVPEEFDPDLERVETAAGYLLALIDDLLDLTRAKAGRMDVRQEPVHLEPILWEVLEVANAQADRGNNAVRVTGGLDGPVLGDANRIRQVLLNLVSNASKFTHDGLIEIVFEAEGDRARVDVRDTGVGMDAVQLGELFEAFNQVHRTRRAELGGTGLGLALSRQLARAMGGDLTVASEVGVGSTFSLHLPRSREA